MAFFKFTGSRGKSSASDASAELVGDITCLLDANGVAWQIGELGRLDLGGGGTIAKYVANRGIPVLDIGVPVLSMHSPFRGSSARPTCTWPTAPSRCSARTRNKVWPRNARSSRFSRGFF